MPMTRRFTLLGLFALCVANFLSAQEDASYTPMLEVGKEWHYTMFPRNAWDVKPDDSEWMFKIEECREIDGQKYYILGDYEDGVKNDLAVDEWGGYRFMIEDCDKRQVTFGILTEDNEVHLGRTIYDFNDPSNGWVSNEVGTFGDEPALYEAFGKSYNAKNGDSDGSVMLVEGFGIITHPDCEGNISKHYFGTLIEGPWPLATGIDCMQPKLYKIVDGSGETIYYLPNARPGYLASQIDAEQETANIEITENAIEIICTGEIGDLAVYTPTGVQVRNMHVSDTHFSLPLTDFAAGVYILRTAGMSRKFTVR